MPDSSRFPKCFGPYLRYAILSSFRDFEFIDEKAGHRLFLLAEFNKTGQQKEIVNALNQQLSGDQRQAHDLSDGPDPPVDLGPASDDIPFATLRTSTEAVTPIEPGTPLFCLWERYVSRVELSLPMKVVVPPAAESRTVNTHWSAGTSKPLLIGIMDDGCPFAAAQFRKGSDTRVRAIWDQNRDRQPVQVNGSSFGQQLSDFTYGLEYLRGSTSSQIGLDEWIALHQTAAGSIDEDSCYADAGFTRLARQQAHGAHVMDLLVGTTPLSSRLRRERPSTGGFDPPSWRPADPTTDPACDTDVVIVQFSDGCICDATGVWLKAYVLEGIRYIMSFAEPDVTENVLINLSYGPTTGPHDGTAELETALMELVTFFDGSHGKPKLDNFFLVGN